MKKGYRGFSLEEEKSMRFCKIILIAVCCSCVSLAGCSTSFCGFRGTEGELMFSCEEVLPEDVPSQQNYEEDTIETKKLPEEEKSSEEETSKETELSLDSRVDLNTATVEELVTLKGIGESRAKAIVEYRMQQGPFTCIEDLMQVTGIKEGVFSKIKDQIVVR